MQIAYNASGFMLRPLIIRNGKVSQETRNKYENHFIFYTVNPPEVNQSCLLIVKDEIHR